MFNINLLDKPGIQSKGAHHIKEKPKKIVSNLENQGSNNMKSNNFENIILPILIVIILFGASIFYYNKLKYNDLYEDISISNILQILKNKDTLFYLKSLQTNNNDINIILNIIEKDSIYTTQNSLDQELDTKTYIKSIDNNNNIYIKYNWFYQQSDVWDISSVYNAISNSKYLNMQLEMVKDKIILVSSYTDLINLFNFLASNQIDHLFYYNISYIDRYDTNNLKYYKVEIKKYD